MGLLLGVALIGVQHQQEILRRRQIFPGIVDVQAFAVNIVALGGVGVGHNGGETGDQLDGLYEHVLQTGVVGILVIGVQRQHAAGQLVHHIGAGILEDNILGKSLGQGPGAGEHGGKLPNLRLVGQIAHQQQKGDLLIAKGAICYMGLDNIFHIDAAIVQTTLRRDDLTVLDIVTDHTADLCHAGHDAGAVAVAQTALDLVGKIFGGDVVLLADTGQQSLVIILVRKGGCHSKTHFLVS